MTLETLSQAQNRLTAEGFVDDLVADDGQLRSAGTDKHHHVDDLVAAELIRFEGDSDPDDEALLVAVASRDGEPIGTFTVPYGPNTSADQSDILTRLHQRVISEEEAAAHQNHDHILAVFHDRAAAIAAVDELRSIGLGSEHLGIAVHEPTHVVFEHDEEADMGHAATSRAAGGAVIGYLAGLALVSAAIPGVGLGGIAAIAGGAALGGGMLGGYLGVYETSDEFDQHEHISHTPLAPHEVLVVVCSHDHPQMVSDALQRHGGRLISSD